MKYKILTLIIVTFFLGCEKKDNNTADYRDKYCGDYIFIVIDYFSQIAAHYYYKDTTIYNGSINIKEYTDSIIIIRYNDGRNTSICGTDSVYGAYIEPSINEQGKMQYNRVLACSNQSGFTGYFIGPDSVYFGVFTGGLGYSSGNIIMGKRIKK